MNQLLLLFSALVACILASEEDAIEYIMASMSKYATRANPMQAGEPTEVKFYLSLQSILDVKELAHGRSADVSIVGWLNYNWQDHRLQWNREECGVRSIQLLPSDIWTPDISLFNSLKPLTLISDQASIYYNGHVSADYKQIFNIRCPKSEADGVISCTMKFGSLTYDSRKLNLTLQYPEFPDIGLDEFDGLSPYRLIDTMAKLRRTVKYYECCPDEPYVEIYATFYLIEKPIL